jgi:hypothetical protein
MATSAMTNEEAAAPLEMAVSSNGLDERSVAISIISQRQILSR